MNNDKNSHQITSSGTTAHPEQTVPDNSQGTHTVAGEGSRSGTSTTPKRGSVYDRITERVMELLQHGSPAILSAKNPIAVSMFSCSMR